MNDFRVIEMTGKKKFGILAGMIYSVPQGATHIYLRNGQLSFGCSASMDVDKRSTNNGRFIRIPDNCKAVSFPEYAFKIGGHYYGRPRWL